MSQEKRSVYRLNLVQGTQFANSYTEIFSIPAQAQTILLNTVRDLDHTEKLKIVQT